jgi:hypothetical protein
MRTLPQEAQGGVRTIHGIVNGDGSINQGVGFTVVRNGVGSYTVRTSLRTGTPVAVPQGGAIGLIAQGAASQFTVATFATTTGAAIDASFGFTAVGR